MIARMLLALLFAAAAALAGGVASKALGVHHFWPGVIVSFIVFFPVQLRIWMRRLS